MRELRRALLAIGLAIAGLALPAGRASAVAMVPRAYGATITVFGHGFGHGRGMGQYGAYGYATQFGWDYHQILDRYYGNTVAGTIDPLSPMTVRLVSEDDSDTIVVNDASHLTMPSLAAGPFAALRIVPRAAPDPTYDVFSSASCSGPWTTQVATGVAGPVRISVVAPNLDSTSINDHIGVCEPAGSVRYYRGDIAAVRDLNSAARTINITTLDRYVRGVVPRESPASWGDAAAGKGMQALKAQAVAARSYSFADNRYSFAKTCDTQACQVYGGSFLKANPSAGAVTLEDQRSDSAVASTPGEIRTRGGTVIATEFSSSTGGNTAPGAFPSVVDDGDAVSINANHNWTIAIPTAAVTDKYPSVGTLLNIQITRRNGIGDLGGRVTQMIVQGTTGSVTLTGQQFQQAIGLMSDWFQVVSSALTSPAGAVANGSGSTYWLATTDGGVLPYNGAQYRGSMLGSQLNGPIVSMTAGSNGQGYWLLGRDGGVFSFNVPFFGSMGATRLNSPVLAIAARPQGDGYWFTAGDGGVFSFGAAPFAGSMGGTRLNQPVVGMAPTKSGVGYWLVASDGGVFAFGDAAFFGSTGAIKLNKPIVGMAARPQGDGYWLVASDGGVFAFGGAPFLGSAPGSTSPVVAISVTGTGNGYRIVSTDGTVQAFGDAT
jgi:SpoIID/LytB domain protein